MLLDQREKVVLSLNATGQVREFQLRLRFRFRLRALAGKELIPASEIALQRDISFNESAVLAEGRRSPALPRHAERRGSADHASPGCGERALRPALRPLAGHVKGVDVLLKEGVRCQSNPVLIGYKQTASLGFTGS